MDSVGICIVNTLSVASCVYFNVRSCVNLLELYALVLSRKILGLEKVDSIAKHPQ